MRGWSGGGDLFVRALLREVGEEQCLVDSSLEDRHAQLHALLNDLAPLHVGLARELRGREMDCHQTDPPVRFATLRWTVARPPDGYNNICSTLAKHWRSMRGARPGCEPAAQQG